MRWNRTVSGATLSICSFSYWVGSSWDVWHLLNMDMAGDFGDRSMDSEVAREIFARVSNWLLYHEWHPFLFDEERDSLFYGVDNGEQRMATHPAYNWVFEYAEATHYFKEMGGRMEMGSLLLSRSREVYETANKFDAPMPYVIYTLFWGGRDHHVRRHLLRVGPKYGW